jgi:hypothetical protein
MIDAYYRVLTMILGQQQSGDIALAAADMRMHINRAGHHHLALSGRIPYQGAHHQWAWQRCALHGYRYPVFFRLFRWLDHRRFHLLILSA